MRATDDRLATIATVASELEAQLLVNLLSDRGIPARATGQWTSQFRAEAPGSIRVVVRSDDLPTAQSIVEEARLQPQPSEPDHTPRSNGSNLKQIAVWTFGLLLIGLFIVWVVLAMGAWLR